MISDLLSVKRCSGVARELFFIACPRCKRSKRIRNIVKHRRAAEQEAFANAADTIGGRAALHSSEFVFPEP